MSVVFLLSLCKEKEERRNGSECKKKRIQELLIKRRQELGAQQHGHITRPITDVVEGLQAEIIRLSDSVQEETSQERGLESPKAPQTSETPALGLCIGYQPATS